MSFISYSQNFEDVMLWRALKNIEEGFYIDIGAAWPDEHSVTKAFYDKGWKGINIEPNLNHFHRLEIERPRDINLQVAVSDTSGALEMTVFEDTGLSTLVSNIAEVHVNNGYQYEKVSVPVVTLTELIEKYLSPEQDVHFLKVDVEGMEERVIKGNNWLSFRPWIIVVEATVPMTDTESYNNWDSLLIESNYLFAYADGLNRFYVAKEHSILIEKFKFPPNVFDQFITYDFYISSENNKILEYENDIYKSRVDELQREICLINNSISWKITKPLRKIKKLIEKIS
ncbi:FkbM family methyltransferase [Vibrio cholerae]|uniref:FkbM family methyltransferase n=4 Tax=Vibrio cholerae TaxID=666 RepID=UPI00067D56EC|nr:FkbM family methyltransferase [Vibrio cholerae]EKY3318379.1 FkbM family methyltransferase [Vibrio cholerae]NOE91052.1 FkbM family methyltransferase [Vibrio cholerae]NOF10994.1 FkbM family methyltransferase [Vibrio cholerae]NOF98186.1 FkbM family methyltransferase [Vibrio cholerae]QKV04782.1 FkbM family methyltransferase [Vibrio cholerae]